MSVNGSIPGSSCQIFTLLVGDMAFVSRDVSLGQSEVNQKYLVGCFVVPHTKVIRFNVSVDKTPVVHVLNSGNHLVD